MNKITVTTGPDLTECLKLAGREKIKYRVDVRLDENEKKVCDVICECDDETFARFKKKFIFVLEH